jgi:AP-4 complex subunit mu-1
VQFTYIKRNQLFFVFTSKDRQLKPAFALELLTKVASMIHDFCGGLEEEMLRTNFIMIYELIDELIDYGHPQITQPEVLRKFVHTQVEKPDMSYM